MKIASSTKLSDREKFEQLGLGRAPTNGKSDIFDRFFENKDLDPQTGGLLGRYVAEERDTGRNSPPATPPSAPQVQEVLAKKSKKPPEPKSDPSAADVLTLPRAPCAHRDARTPGGTGIRGGRGGG